jgi:hypothetical protein
VAQGFTRRSGRFGRRQPTLAIPAPNVALVLEQAGKTPANGILNATRTWDWKTAMKSRLLNTLLGTSIVVFATIGAGEATTRWATVAPPGEGFSVEAPGEAQPDVKPGRHVYSAGLWLLSVHVDPSNVLVRDLLQRREREGIARCLEGLRDAMVNSVHATRRTSSVEDFDGAPSIVFSFEGEVDGTTLEAFDRIVLTPERTYILMTAGPKAAVPNAEAQRFLESFRLVRTAAAQAGNRPSSTASPSTVIVTKLAGPMIAVARLITEEKLRPLIDDRLQTIPAAARLGSRWNPSNEAWGRARTSFSARIDRIAEAYSQSGEAERKLESELTRVAAPDLEAIAAMLDGPVAPAVLRREARLQFVVMVMSADPNGPKAGDPAWSTKMHALVERFDARIGPALPADDGARAAEADRFGSSAAGRTLTRLWDSVVSKATVQIEGALNLVLFDDREAITREVEAAIKSVK